LNQKPQPVIQSIKRLRLLPDFQ